MTFWAAAQNVISTARKGTKMKKFMFQANNEQKMYRSNTTSHMFRMQVSEQPRKLAAIFGC
jgi:hypothetical protein